MKPPSPAPILPHETDRSREAALSGPGARSAHVIFDGLNDIDAATARRHFHLHHLRPGEVLTRAGERSRGLAIVEEGELVAEVAGAEVGRIRSGDMLGEAGLFADMKRTATVRAVRPTTLSLLTREGYEALRDTVHPICLNIERATLLNQVRRLRAAGKQVAELGLGVPLPRRPKSSFFDAVARLFGRGALQPTAGDALEALHRSPLFHGEPLPAVAPIAALFTPWTCCAGTFLCTEGEEGTAMFILARGEVEVLVAMAGEPHQVATLEPGAAFGMVSLASGEPRMSSCVARGPCQIYRLDRDSWTRLVEEPYLVGSTFRRAVIRAFSDQLAYTNAQIAEYCNRIPSAEADRTLREAQRGLHSHDKVVASLP